MKQLIFSAIALFALINISSAQTAGGIWVGSKTATGETKAVHDALQKGFGDFMPGGNPETGWAIYTENAAEVDPGGNITFGLSALKAGWDAFSKMTDEPAKFKYDNVQVRMLTNDVALVVFDSEADIKIHGQQIGGKVKGSAVMHKVNGVWKLEFDQLSPVMPMPTGK